MKTTQIALAARRQKILLYLQKHQFAKISTLSELLGVSDLTIRRDLSLLEVNGLLTRIPGGAHLPSGSDVSPRSIDNLTLKKEAIAKCAASFIENDDCIFINSSSTALLVYQYIQNTKVTIITNNGNSVQAPLNNDTELLLTGGEVSRNKHSLVGQHALNLISQVTCNKCLIGVTGIHPDRGITTAIHSESTINNAMIHHCTGEVIVVADSSKLGHSNKFFTGDLKHITHLITDIDADNNTVKALEQLGIHVILVEYLNKEVL